MSFVNNYKPTPSPNPITAENDHRATPLEEYDYNFIYPVTTLRSSRVELRPVLPSRDAKEVARVLRENPGMMEFDDWPSDEDGVFRQFEELRQARNALSHAIYASPPSSSASSAQSSPSEYVLAGITSFHHLYPDDLGGEIGIFVFPQFQRTHVATHALGLALKRLMDMPVPSPDGRPVSKEGGFGYRRAVWTCDDLNVASFKLGSRMGFKLEGVRRNMSVIPKGKPATGRGRAGDFKDGQPSVNQTLMSITCSDWEEGGRELVEKQMARTT